MEKFLQEEIEYLAMEGAEKDRINSEKEAKISQGQTPTVNTQVYDPKKLKDNGYSLSEPGVMPNNHTKEGKMIFANGDPATTNTVGRVTELPAAEGMLPTTRAYVNKTDEFYGTLRDVESTEDAEMGLQEAFFQYKIYEGFTNNEEEYNRIAWNSADQMERVGFSHLTASERDDEGLDDRGMVGLQFVMGSMIFRGAKSFDEAARNIGPTGANSEQLKAAWESAVKAAHRNAEGMIDPVAATNEQAMQDPRYRGAVQTYLLAKGEMTPEGIEQLTPEEIVQKGKMISDMFKSNFAKMGSDLILSGKNADSEVGNALMYMLEVDEAMPFEGADFGRNILGLATDPTSYMGGAGLLTRMTAKMSGVSLAKQALLKAGASGKFGATFGAGYGGLYDIGMQTIEKQGGAREEYDPARFGKAAAIGGALGYSLGAVTSIAPEAVKATVGWFKNFKTKNAKTVDGFNFRDDNPGFPAFKEMNNQYNVERMEPFDLSAAQEFKDIPIPDNISTTLDVRRTIKEAKDQPDLDASLNPPEGGEGMTLGHTDDEVLDEAIRIADEEIPQDMNDWVDDLLAENPAGSSQTIVETMGESIRVMLKDTENFQLSGFDELKLQRILNMINGSVNDMERLVDAHRKNRMSVIKGGADEIDPEHAAPIELIPDDPILREELTLISELDYDEKKTRLYSYPEEQLEELLVAEPRLREWWDQVRRIDSATEEANVALRDDGFEEFDRYDRADPIKWKSDTAHGAEPDLKLIRNETYDLAANAIKRDPQLGVDLQRQLDHGTPMPKRASEGDHEFLQGTPDELTARREEFMELSRAVGPGTHNGKMLVNFADLIGNKIASIKGISLVDYGYNPKAAQVDRQEIARKLYRDELRDVAGKMSDVEEIQQLYQDRLDPSAPYFDFATSVNKREGMTDTERKFFDDIFNNRNDLLELLDGVPSISNRNNILTVKREDMFNFDEYLEVLVQLHDGPASEIPKTIRDGTFIKKRMLEFKEDN